LQAKVEPGSVVARPKLASVAVVTAAGPLVIEVLGAVLSETRCRGPEVVFEVTLLAFETAPLRALVPLAAWAGFAARESIA
jgi:hypothetical protein